MDGETDLARGRDDVLELVERPDAPAGRVVRVLEREDRRALIGDLRARLGSRAHLLRREPPAVAGKRRRHEPRVRSRAAVLVDHDVRVLLRDEDVAGPRVQLERDLVRHRRGRHEDRRLVPEERRGALLERVDGRILALLLVPDLRLRDRAPHALGRPRRGVGAQVDHGRDATVRGMDLALLERTLAERGAPAYRARQVWEWTARGVTSYEDMTTLPKALRTSLEDVGSVLDARARHRA